MKKAPASYSCSSLNGTKIGGKRGKITKKFPPFATGATGQTRDFSQKSGKNRSLLEIESSVGAICLGTKGRNYFAARCVAEAKQMTINQ